MLPPTDHDINVEQAARLCALWGKLDHAESILMEAVQVSYLDPADYPPRELESIRVQVARVRDELVDKINGR